MMNLKTDYKSIIKETSILTVGVAIIAAAVYFFLVPSHASVSSISGLGIVLSNFIPLPLSAITMILNVVLLIIGFFTCGREFGVKTVYTSVMLPLFLGVFERIFPDFGSMTNSQELDVLCYILVVSVGLSILFNRNASSGGLDIVAKIMNKYLHMDLGKAMSLSGMCVALSAVHTALQNLLSGQTDPAGIPRKILLLLLPSESALYTVHLPVALRIHMYMLSQTLPLKYFPHRNEYIHELLSQS